MPIFRSCRIWPQRRSPSRRVGRTGRHVAIKGGIHYEGYLGVVAPGNAYNVTLGGTNSGGTAVATAWGGSIYYAGTNTGGSTFNAEPFVLNVLSNGSAGETKRNALVLDTLPIGNNKFFGDDASTRTASARPPRRRWPIPSRGTRSRSSTSTARASSSTRRPGPRSPSPRAGAWRPVQLSRHADDRRRPRHGADLHRGRTPRHSVPGDQLQDRSDPDRGVGCARLHGRAQPVLEPAARRVNNGVDILNYNGVNLVSQAETYAAAHQAFAGIVAGTEPTPRSSSLPGRSPSRRAGR